MNRYIKKCLSFLLSVSLLFAVLTPMASAGSWKVSRTDIPTIFVKGYGSTLYADPANPSEDTVVYPCSKSDTLMDKLIPGIVPVLAKAVVTGDYTEYCDYIYDALYEIYEPMTLDKNGEPSNGSGMPYWETNINLHPSNTVSGGTYGHNDYYFRYDWRTDTCAVADELNAYIKRVKAVTGAEKVNIYSRCYGCCVELAYLAEYGYDDVAGTFLINSATSGHNLLGACFSGQLDFTPDTMNAWVNENYGENIAEDDTMYLLIQIANLLDKSIGLAGATNLANDIYQKVADNLMPRLVKSIWGTMPGFWNMIGDEYYGDAMVFLYGENYLENEEYAGIISKLEDYNTNVRTQITSIITRALDAGISVGSYVKYGYYDYPFFENSKTLTDCCFSLETQAFGATCSQVRETLPEEYITQVKAEGNGKFISPDSQVDMSTSLLRDTTWVIKGLHHNYFPDCFTDLAMRFLNSHGTMTVDNATDFYRFMHWDADKGEFTELTAENAHQEDKENDFWDSFTFLFMKIMKFFNDLLDKIVNGLYSNP